MELQYILLSLVYDKTEIDHEHAKFANKKKMLTQYFLYETQSKKIYIDGGTGTTRGRPGPFVLQTVLKRA